MEQIQQMDRNGLLSFIQQKGNQRKDMFYEETQFQTRDWLKTASAAESIENNIGAL